MVKTRVLFICLLYCAGAFTFVDGEDEIIEAIPAVGSVSPASVILVRGKRQVPFLSNWWNPIGYKSSKLESTNQHKYYGGGDQKSRYGYHNRTSGVVTGNGVSDRDARCKNGLTYFSLLNNTKYKFIIKN